MNADEIVKALERMAPQFHAPGKEVVSGAADLIESLQAQLIGLKDIAGRYDQLQEKHRGLMAEADGLEARLAESQRQLQAAVEDFEGCMKNKKERCAYCIHDDECEPGESLCCVSVCGFEWRGPQEAGKGEAE